MPKYIIAERPLTDSERDDKNAQSLLRSSRKPHKSRKHKERRAPREHQQKSRVTVEDNDISRSDPDLSLGKRFNAADIALRLVFSAGTPFDDLLGVTRKLLQKASPALLKEFESTYAWARGDQGSSLRTSAGSPDHKKNPSPSVNVELLKNRKKWLKEVLDNIAPYVNASKKKGESPEYWDVKSGAFDLDDAYKLDLKHTIETLGLSDDIVNEASTWRVTKRAFSRLIEYYNQIVSDINDATSLEADETKEVSPTGKSSDSRVAILKRINDDYNRITKYPKNFSNNPISLISEVEKYWKADDDEEPPFGSRAGILLSLEWWLKSQVVLFPKTIRNLATDLLKGSISSAAESFAKKLLESDRVINKEDVKSEEFLSWAVGYKLWDALYRTGDLPKDTKRFVGEIDQFTSQVYRLMGDALRAQKLDEALDSLETKGSEALVRAIDEGDRANLPEDILARLEEYDKAFESLLSGVDSPKSKGLSTQDELNIEYLNALKKEMLSKHPSLRKSLSSSYEALTFRMQKTATYHGVLQQGHPDGPYTGWTYLDKRELNSRHFERIISSAKEHLGGAWLKTGWDNGSSDAQVRAALDLAIATADDSAYQSKIDAPTYERLLNRLASYGLDLFQDTLIPPNPTTRKANDMTNPVQDMIRIASEIEADYPHLALQIIAATRKLSGGTHIASDDQTVSLPVGMLVKLAFDNPGTRETLIPIIAAKRKKVSERKTSGKKNTGKKVSTKKESSKSGSASRSASDHVPPKGKRRGKGKARKASLSLDPSDSSW